MNEYEHTQPGTLIRVLQGAFTLFLGGNAITVYMNGDERTAMLLGGIALLMFVLLALFHSLTVTVTPNDVSLAFGIGLISKGFLAEDIEGATAVRTSFINGWGIKKIHRGWLYNVSGYDAVELQLKGGRVARIGTDEPQELLAAVQSVIGNKGP